MDPVQTLIEFLRAVQDGDAGGVREYAEYLAEWIEKGGFMPDTQELIKALRGIDNPE